MVDLCDKAGLTDEALVKIIAAGCKAKKTQFFQNNGIVTDSREVVDHAMRHTYATTALQLKGRLNTGTQINVDASKKSVMVFEGQKEEELATMSAEQLIGEVIGRLSRQRTKS